MRPLALLILLALAACGASGPPEVPKSGPNQPGPNQPDMGVKHNTN